MESFSARYLYSLPIYGGTDKKYITKIQTIMNNAIRHVTGLHKRTSTDVLMREVGWLDIRELITFHSLLMFWRIIYLKTPRYMMEKLNVQDDISISPQFTRLQNTRMGFRWRTIPLWNSMNLELRTEKSYPRFKKNLKNWILKNRPQIDPD